MVLHIKGADQHACHLSSMSESFCVHIVLMFHSVHEKKCILVKTSDFCISMKYLLIIFLLHTWSWTPSSYSTLNIRTDMAPA